jgi:hypothetical protein
MKVNPKVAAKQLDTDLKALAKTKAQESAQLAQVKQQEQKLIDNFDKLANPTDTQELEFGKQMWALGQRDGTVRKEYGADITAEITKGRKLLPEADKALTFKQMNADRKLLGLKPVKQPPASKKSGADAYKVAHSVLGKNIDTLKHSGPLAKYLDKWVSNHVCCANFVSACLQKAGLITHGEHNDGVKNLSNNLAHDKHWSKASPSHMKPGDVVCFDVPGEGHFAHVEMFAGYKNGQPIFIGSNNVNPDGSQRISMGHAGYHIDAVYHYHG